jgi:hypothetical protein
VQLFRKKKVNQCASSQTKVNSRQQVRERERERKREVDNAWCKCIGRKKKNAEFQLLFFLFCVRVRYRCIGALGFECFSHCYSLYSIFFIVNFSGSSPTVNVGLLSRTT